MSSRAAQARETARSTDGKFGHQPHDRAGGVDLIDPPGGLSASDSLRISEQLRTPRGAHIGPRQMAALGDNGLVYLESRDRSRSWAPVRGDLLVDGPRGLSHEDRGDFEAYCRSLGGSSQIDAEGNGTFSAPHFELKNAHDLDSLPGRLAEADPSGARFRDHDTDYRDYREDSVTEREKVARTSVSWALQDAQLRLTEQAFMDGDDAADFSEVPMDPETEKKANERIQQVLSSNWALIEDASRETGLEREEIADAASDSLAWDSDWHPKLSGGPEEAGKRTKYLIQTIDRHRGPFADQSPFVHNGAIHFE